MKKLVFILGLALGLLCATRALSRPPADLGSTLIENAGPSIVMLTPPNIATSGGTGFTVLSPTGKRYTLTNAHICGLAEDGALGAHVDGSSHTVRIRVLEVATTTDLCLLEAVPNLPPLVLADGVKLTEHLYALGHPFLNPLTLTDGYLTDRSDIVVNMGEVDEASCTAIHGVEVPVITPMGGALACMRTLDGYDSSIIIYPGNSGSPILNRKGQVVGVAFASSSATHYGSIIPLAVVARFLSVY